MLSDKLSLRMELHEFLGWIYSKLPYNILRYLKTKVFAKAYSFKSFHPDRITFYWIAELISQAAGPLSLIIILSIFVYFSANFVIWQYLIVNLTRFFLIQVISSVVYLNPFSLNRARFLATISWNQNLSKILHDFLISWTTVFWNFMKFLTFGELVVSSWSG